MTERANKTLKYEWLKRVVLIRGFKHLTELCDEFQTWYNQWRPHMTLDGLRPNDVFYGNPPEMPGHDAKEVPPNIEQRYFSQARTMGYRLTVCLNLGQFQPSSQNTYAQILCFTGETPENPTIYHSASFDNAESELIWTFQGAKLSNFSRVKAVSRSVDNYSFAGLSGPVIFGGYRRKSSGGFGDTGDGA